MDIFFQVLYHSICNILYTLKSPLFWVVVVIIFFQYRKIGELEKGVLGGYKTPPIYNVLISTIIGLIGGIIGSILSIYLGIIISPIDFYYILPLAILLSMIHPRFICFSYAGGIISLSSLIFGWPSVNVSGIMFIVGVLHLVESFLVLVDGSTGKIPIFMERQGEIIGGFTMNRFWPVPFTVFINNSGIYPVTIIAILGYGDYALTNYPEKKSKETAGVLSIFSITLVFLAMLSVDYYTFKYISAFFAPLGHEIIIMLGRKREKRGSNIFAPSNQGLKVLDTLPDSIGEKMNINPGDIVLAVNGNRVYTKRDIEEVLYFRPKFIWLDIFDRKKGLITKEYKNYPDSISSLGIIVVSNVFEYAYLVEETKSPILKLWDKLKKKKDRFKN